MDGNAVCNLQIASVVVALGISPVGHWVFQAQTFSFRGRSGWKEAGGS